MRPDVIDLQTFYGSPRGLLVRRLLIRQMRQLWPDLSGCRVLGLGYAVPFLAPISEGAERVIAVMPEGQGALAWPADRPNQVALAADHDLPLADRSIDRVLIAHALESAEPLRPMLREVWRVLADGGQAMIMVPNRRGLWCLFETTPFGYGQPYSSGQLKETLRGHLFTPRQTGRALFMPPLRSRLLMRTAVAWERIGLRWARHFAGVVLMVAEKQIYAAPMEMAPARRGAGAYAPVAGRLAAAERVRGESQRADDAPRDPRG